MAIVWLLLYSSCTRLWTGVIDYLTPFSIFGSIREEKHRYLCVMLSHFRPSKEKGLQYWNTIVYLLSAPRCFRGQDSNLQGLVLEIAFFWLVSSGSGERRKEASLDHDLTAFTCGAVLGPVKTTLNSFNTRPGLTKRTNVVDGVTHFTALPHNGHPSGVALEDSGCS